MKNRWEPLIAVLFAILGLFFMVNGWVSGLPLVFKGGMLTFFSAGWGAYEAWRDRDKA